jgi:hypothetical protein
MTYGQNNCLVSGICGSLTQLKGKLGSRSRQTRYRILGSACSS